MRSLRRSLFALFLMALPVFAQQEAPKSPGPSLIVTGLDSDGLELISPETPEFDVRVGKLFSVQATNAVLAFKPLLVILSNHTKRAVVAYAFVWKITYESKRTSITTTEYKYPDAIAGSPDIGNVPLERRDDRPLPGGQEKPVASEVELGPGWEEPFYRDQLLSLADDEKRDLADAETIEITLDAAIFSDGQLVGPDHSNLEQSFMASFESKQKLFRQVVSDLNSGKTVEEAFAPVNLLAGQRPTSPRLNPAFYEIIAATEVRALRKRIGDPSVKITFEQAIRKEPFAIRREPAASQ